MGSVDNTAQVANRIADSTISIATTGQVTVQDAFNLLPVIGWAGGRAAKAIMGWTCFAAGTPLLTPDGSKPIEEFRFNDLVLSRSEDDPEGPVVARRVLNVFQNDAPLVELRVVGRAIRTTAEHPFWVRGRGWLNAQEIESGDAVLSTDRRWLTIDPVEGPLAPEPVYNVEIVKYYTYFVDSQS